ncbi:MAG: type II toxin-antitoxin system HicA family toxin [Candidatus Thermoplasmatota archaeon]|nr:type II toxin-antitoxin system HicA family toxin [Candidatus Thermoplasmatota archaeon]MDP7264475.1 type II toxin-antitoxin system HicA family toxin [Candidatus Thermoplasmatota archaeon]
MSPRLPVISGELLIKVLAKIGYSVVRQRGRHLRLKDSKNPFHPTQPQNFYLWKHSGLKTLFTLSSTPYFFSYFLCFPAMPITPLRHLLPTMRHFPFS